MEVKGLNYQYLEVDPYQKPESLLEVNPRGLVPALRHGDWGCHESTVLMEYVSLFIVILFLQFSFPPKLEDLDVRQPLLPQGDPKARAHSRLWSDHVCHSFPSLSLHFLSPSLNRVPSGRAIDLISQINRNIIPSFYRYLQAQDPTNQAEFATELRSEILKITNVAHHSGPFFLGPDISFVDIQFAPWIIRMRKVLTPYRGWPDPEPGSRWATWVEAVEKHESVKATTSGDELYLDSYERYAGKFTLDVFTFPILLLTMSTISPPLINWPPFKYRKPPQHKPACQSC